MTDSYGTRLKKNDWIIYGSITAARPTSHDRFVAQAQEIDTILGRLYIRVKNHPIEKNVYGWLTQGDLAFSKSRKMTSREIFLFLLEN